MKKFLVLLIGLVGLVPYVQASESPEVIFFYGNTCAHCRQEEQYLTNLKQVYDFEVIGYEVYEHPENIELLKAYSDCFGVNFNAVPLLIMGGEYLEGDVYDKTVAILEKYARKKGEQPDTTSENSLFQCKNLPQGTISDPTQGLTPQKVDLSGILTTLSGTDTNIPKSQHFSLFGKEISLKNVGPVVFGILLGLADGINPCMFGVLIFLLTYLVSIGSKKKVLYSGIIFTITTFVMYFILMFLMHKVLFSTTILLPYISYIKYGIGMIAITLGLIEIKDFFRYGKGISLKIPNFIKPTLEYITKKGTYMSAFILAVLSTLVELPCTVGIPLAYIGAIGKEMNLFLALGIYNFCFVIPLLVIIFGIYGGMNIFTPKKGEQMVLTQVQSKKWMRLLAGTVLVILGILFLLKVF